jgi:hypothetical protein
MIKEEEELEEENEEQPNDKEKRNAPPNATSCEAVNKRPPLGRSLPFVIPLQFRRPKIVI